jgi:hypothetical protein
MKMRVRWSLHEMQNELIQGKRVDVDRKRDPVVTALLASA